MPRIASSLPFLLLAAFHEIMDVRGYVKWAKAFIWVGASAIVLYVFNHIAGFFPIAQRIAGGEVAALQDAYLIKGAGEFIAAALGLTLAVLAARFLYRRKIFLRV